MPASTRLIGTAAAASIAVMSVALGGAPRDHGDPGGDTLDANDGWAAFGAGTTGGSAAAAEHVYVATAAALRFGQVHIYDNYYELKHDDAYQYSWGVGIESAIYAENNFFRADHDVTPDRFISRLNGTAIATLETRLNAASDTHAVDVRAEYNAVNDPDLSEAVGWTPSLFLPMDPAFKVPSAVISGAGPFKWR
jgi:pectate lyase